MAESDDIKNITEIHGIFYYLATGKRVLKRKPQINN